jgi:hypothetical protein
MSVPATPPHGSCVRHWSRRAMPRAPPNLKAFGSRSRSASDASVATAGPCNHRPAARPTPCHSAALCPWQRAWVLKSGRVRWPEPPGLAAGSHTRGETSEECGAWSGPPTERWTLACASRSHTPLLALGLRSTDRLDDRASQIRALGTGGVMVARSPPSTCRWPP